MTNKYLKFLFTICLVLCIASVSLTVTLAAPEDGSDKTSTTIETDNFDNEETSEESTTKGSVIVAPVTTEIVIDVPDTTENQTKPTKPTTEKNTAVNNTVDDKRKPTTQRDDDDSSSTEVETTEGPFEVQLELNNGQPRKRYKLEEPGLVPQPNVPERKGYVFDGWYADAKFKTPWNFLTSIADENTVIYAKWIADGSTVVYHITVLDVEGGTVQVNPSVASAGEPVTITITPDEGKRVVTGSIKINNKSTDVHCFIMPAEDVVISVEFENVPETKEDDDKISVVPFLIGGAVVILAILVAAVIINKIKSRPAVVEYDENGAIILDDDDDDGWIDDSIVIEEGFSNGKIVKENVEPDYGPADDEDLT